MAGRIDNRRSSISFKASGIIVSDLGLVISQNQEQILTEIAIKPMHCSYRNVSYMHHLIGFSDIISHSLEITINSGIYFVDLFPGAVLIFLPGYDEIVGLRDRILYDDKRFADNSHK